MLQCQPDLRETARLAIVGNGPLLEGLRLLAKSLGIGTLTWMPGAVSNVPAILRAFDLFVLPSLSEGISNTILEAMASGLPVLATAVGGNIELIEAGRSGDFFQPGDVQSLASLLTKYVSDPSLRHEQGRAARRIATEKFSLAAMVANYQAVYEAMIGPSVPR
jgi:glycosyltransferase involved in cell wall biosynthesis